MSIRAIFALTLIPLLLCASAQAQVEFLETFDSPLDPAVFSVSMGPTFTYTVEGGHLLIESDGSQPGNFSGCLYWRPIALGDFSAEIEYWLITFPHSSTGWNKVELSANIPGTGSLIIVRVRRSSDQYWAWSFEAGYLAVVPTSDMAGTLRLVRTGNVFSMYFKGAGSPDFQLLWSGPCGTGPANLRFYAKRQHSDTPIAVQFDNFSISADDIAFPPTVAEVAASQRPDATRVVDIAYTLSGEEESYSVSVQASDDGGTSWDITPSAVWGDVGEVVVPGTDKHIVWNPSVDLPGIGGSNFKVRLSASNLYQTVRTESNVFSITAAGPGDLMGTVRDQMSGDEVVGADVSVNGEPAVQTDEYGQFFFSEVPAGQATIDVSAAGYYAVTQNVQIREDSFTNVDILLTPDMGFGVVEVRSPYCGPGQHAYYLDWVWMYDTFTATIDWDTHTPDKIRWTVSTDPDNPIEESCTSDTCSHTFNMGWELGEGATITVTAIAADSTESTPYPVNFKVIPAPIGILPFLLSHDQSSSALKYVTAKIVPEEPEEDEEPEMSIEEGADEVSDDTPLFGKEKFKFGGTFEIGAEVNGDGTATGPSFEATADKEGEFETKKKKTRIAGAAVNLHASGAMDWEWDDGLDRWKPGGWIELGADVSVDVPPKPLVFTFGPIPCYFRGRIEASALVHLEMVDWLAPGRPEWQGTITLDPFPYAEAMLGAGVADVLAVEGYLGGKATLILVFPQPDPVDTLQISLAGGVRVVVWIFKWDWPLLEYTWDIHDKRWVVRQSEPVFDLMPRDYLHRRGGYAVFVANEYSQGGLRDIVTEEHPIQLNVFSQSTPDLAAVGDDLLSVWVYDDPVRTSTNRTEIVFSEYDSTTELWTEPVAVADDGTADFHPQIAALPNGDALLAWENVSDALIEPGEPGDPCIAPCEDECLGEPDPPACEYACKLECKLEELKSKTEIAVSLYDANSNAWSTPTMLTSNGYLDRSPRIATASDGTAMLTWVSNTANLEMGSNGVPNDIHYATFDGAGWSAPAEIAIDVPSVVKSATAYDGTEAVLLFIGDTDDDTRTPYDRELFAVTYDGMAWSEVTQLTSNGVGTNGIEEANPQVAYDSSGDLLMVWYSGGDIVMATELDLSDQQTVVDLEADASIGAADFRLATGSTSQIALVWQEASENRVDMWSAIYDPTVEVWSKPQCMTRDFTTNGEMEHAMAPVYDASGDLVAVYDKVQTVYETRTVWVGGQEVQLDNVPVPGQSDLYLLRHTISGDLAVTSNGVTLDPPNPVAGQTATITATVQNLGDVPAVDLDVAFYDGDPGAGGILIDITSNAEPLVGGDEREVSVDWLVSTTGVSHDLYVVVDPDQDQEDRDRTNNTSVLPGVMKPDVLIDSILVQSAGPADRILTIRVLNGSGLAVSNVDVTIRRDAEDGSVLHTQTITDTIVPGAFYDLSWVWEDAAPFPGGLAEVFAIADEADTIDEFDEDNNVRSAFVTNRGPTRPGDWDDDGDVDLFDYAVFLGCISGPWEAPGFVMPSQDCLDVFDFNADADVDLGDFAAFQESFTGSL
ncbi:MAG: carboxypeptidase regulatory-like domain-containing protein [Phycisphaerae bacterium]|nr:carboxypeptidase regulatory-like domain-containing protein [Phycisphaerae bacterium]